MHTGNKKSFEFCLLLLFNKEVRRRSFRFYEEKKKINNKPIRSPQWQLQQHRRKREAAPRSSFKNVHYLLALGVSRKINSCSAALILLLLLIPSFPPGKGATTLASAKVTLETAAPPAKNSNEGTARTL